MPTTWADPVADESGSHTCVSDQRPGPHRGSEKSSMLKATARQFVESSVLDDWGRAPKPSAFVPSKKVGPVGDTDCDGVKVVVGVSDGERVCVGVEEFVTADAAAVTRTAASVRSASEAMVAGLTQGLTPGSGAVSAAAKA